MTSENIEKITEARRRFAGAFPNFNGDTSVYFAPGRVCLIGEHIDYNGGYVLPAAISLGVYMVVGLTEDNFGRFASADKAGTVTVTLREPPRSSAGVSWANYPLGVTSAFIAHGAKMKGFCAYYSADLPAGAGLSSSAAIETVTATAWAELFFPEIAKDKLAIAEMCKEIENNFVGVQCGIMDQFASAMGRAEFSILLNCDNIQNYFYVPFLSIKYSLVIMDTRKPRSLSESKFNERFTECQAALAYFPEAKNLTEVSLDALEIIREPHLKARARHVITENTRVLAAATALETDDALWLGKLFRESHASLRDNYEVTGTALDAIVVAANDAPGALGARMTGAGFGGCAIALIEASAYDDFCQFVSVRYQQACGITPYFYKSTISDGARKLA